MIFKIFSPVIRNLTSPSYTKIQGYRVQGYRDTEIQGYTDIEIQEYRDTGIQ